MEYRYIGKTGLRVSPICLGTMTFGSSADKKESFKIMDRAYEAGINFFDTAELYPVPPKESWSGMTEEIVGDWLKTKQRDSVIIASKVAGAANGWFVPPIRHGLTAIDRFHIKRAVEGSLKRLKTDYIDLYQVHWPDQTVPVEEALEVFDELIKEGKIRYIGTSNDTAYGLTKANEVAKCRGYKRFESIQNNFSLLNRRFLDSISEVCKKEQISLLPYSPLAGGVLSGKYNKEYIDPTARFAWYMNEGNPRLISQVKRFVNDKSLESTKLYLEIAKKYQLSPVTLSIAWSKQFDFVASTIIGARKAEQLDESLAAMDLVLDKDILNECDKVHQKILYPMG
jgi:aryl-alcohol dehydrogenase-like predicted oxidoreductase